MRYDTYHVSQTTTQDLYWNLKQMCDEGKRVMTYLLLGLLGLVCLVWFSISGVKGCLLEQDCLRICKQQLPGFTVTSAEPRNIWSNKQECLCLVDGRQLLIEEKQ